MIFDPLWVPSELVEAEIQLKISWEDLRRHLATCHGVKKHQRLFSNIINFSVAMLVYYAYIAY